MQLTVLVDNNTLIDRYYLGEPGVAYYLEDGDVRILFDVGYSDIFLRNAQALGIDLSRLQQVVLSHGHNDHTRGLLWLSEQEYFSELQLLAHPDALKPKQFAGESIGAPFTAQQLQEKCRLRRSKEPVWLTKRLVFLGEIPTLNDFEQRHGFGSAEDPVDLVLDDTALVYRGSEGLFVITGCSHSGICNIIEYAKKVCGEAKVQGVIGGWHLFKVDDRLEKTIAYLQKHNIRELYPCHCCSFQAKAAIHAQIPVKEIGVGKVIEIN